jgi:hypothetical protein
LSVQGGAAPKTEPARNRLGYRLDEAHCVVCKMVRDVQSGAAACDFAIVTAFVVGREGGGPIVCAEHSAMSERAAGYETHYVCRVCRGTFPLPVHGMVVTRSGPVAVCSGECFVKASQSEDACTIDEAERGSRGVG